MHNQTHIHTDRDEHAHAHPLFGHSQTHTYTHKRKRRARARAHPSLVFPPGAESVRRSKAPPREFFFPLAMSCTHAPLFFHHSTGPFSSPLLAPQTAAPNRNALIRPPLTPPLRSRERARAMPRSGWRSGPLRRRKSQHPPSLETEQICVPPSSPRYRPPPRVWKDPAPFPHPVFPVSFVNSCTHTHHRRVFFCALSLSPHPPPPRPSSER
jgi:hypothetical protein